MAQQVPVDRSAQADEIQTDGVHQAAPDLAYQRLAIVNVAYYGQPGASSWTLIDAGVMGMTNMILGAVEKRFGGVAPAAIIMTHGHFDHVGALRSLAERWNVPVYAHELELPFLNGTSSYPPPDPSVGGGLMATLSRFYPRGPVDVSQWLQPLPSDGSVPHMPDWRWIHTPGHTQGHVSFWRESDRTLLAGDAFVTTAQESAYAVAVQQPEVHGPPMYFTEDWVASRTSVQTLAALEPELVITGHGRAMAGAGLREPLHTLAREFARVAVPRKER